MTVRIDAEGDSWRSTCSAPCDFDAGAPCGECWRREQNEDEEDSYLEQPDAAYSYHSTNPIQLFGWPAQTNENELCFGVELEMEGQEGHEQQDVSNALGGRDGGLAGGDYLLMNDGSLDDSGVELITSPYTLTYHQNLFKWDTLLARLRGIAMSGAGTNSCGMHVHCNRKAISALTLGKMLVFVNSDTNTRLIRRIAQRDGAQWARRFRKRIRDGIAESSDKYEALHVARSTIEFRIFRGNLRYERVLKNIEFCHSVVTYCQTASVVAVDGHTDYLAWLGKNRGMYPNLVRFLGETYGFKATGRAVTEEL